MNHPTMAYSFFSVIDHYPAERFIGHTRTIAEFYQQLIEQAKLADELGYDSFFVAEHHFTEYGVAPNPAILLAALAQHTQRIKLAPAVAVLPFHDPRLVAEDYAMIDQFTGGRLVMAAGSGYLKHEFDGFSGKPESKRFQFDEALDIIRRLWNGETVTLKSDHHDLNNVKINVLPLQDEVPVYIAALRADVVYHIGKAGHNLMTVPYASVDRFEQIADMMSDFRRGAGENKDMRGGKSVMALHTFVAENDARVRELAADAFNLYVETRSYAKRQTYDDILASGLSLFGSVEAVAEKLVKLYSMGVDHVMLLQNFGDVDAEAVKQSMTLIAREVMPRVNERLKTAMAG